MVQVFANNGYFSGKGTFDFGCIGLYAELRFTDRHNF